VVKKKKKRRLSKKESYERWCRSIRNRVRYYSNASARGTHMRFFPMEFLRRVFKDVAHEYDVTSVSKNALLIAELLLLRDLGDLLELVSDTAANCKNRRVLKAEDFELVELIQNKEVVLACVAKERQEEDDE
jgi:hypothetical protein